MPEAATVLDKVDAIRWFRLRTLQSGLLLEIQGMHRRGRSAYSIIKKEFGLRGNRQSVYTQFCELVDKERSCLTSKP